jgi:hypothetical protein
MNEERLIDPGHWKCRAMALEQHRLANRPGQADHGMTECDGVLTIVECSQRSDEAVEIDLLGVEQRAVHVEQDGVDGPSPAHLALTLACCSANFRKHAGHRQSPPSVGIGRRKLSSEHQQGPPSVHENSVPQVAQARRRGEGCLDRSVMTR